MQSDLWLSEALLPTAVETQGLAHVRRAYGGFPLSHCISQSVADTVKLDLGRDQCAAGAALSVDEEFELPRLAADTLTCSIAKSARAQTSENCDASSSSVYIVSRTHTIWEFYPVTQTCANRDASFSVHG